MKWFYNLKIAAKLIIGFIIVAIIAGVVGVVGIININAIDKADIQLYEESTMGLDYAGEAAIYFQRARFNTLKMTIERDSSLREDCFSKIEDYSNQVDNYLNQYDAGIEAPEDREIFNVLKPQWDEYRSYIEEAVALAHSEKNEEAMNLINGDAATVATNLQDSFDKIFDYNSVTGKSISDNNTQLADKAMLIMLITIIAGVIIAISLGLFISRILSKPIKNMVQAADKLAVGDVDVHTVVSSKDEIGDLNSSLGRMVENIQYQAQVAKRLSEGDMTVEVDIKSEKDVLGKALSEIAEKNNEVLSNIASSSEQVAVGSKQVSDSSIILSQGATEQASSVEELTASLEEISSQTKLNAGNANQANELAINAKKDAMQGNAQMKDMLKSMEDINESSANISKIIKVIDDIAFQTNILALNAAVEAARAGQHGKGFAVVAEEVKNLSARSANAAKETTAMIEGSIKKAENGTRIAKDTAEALGKIVGGIEKVAELVNDIAIASNEQAIGIGQINQGIMQVSQVVQNNSATSEEGAAASEELSSQAELLKELVGQFKLKKSTRAYNRMDEISPDVMAMLENMADKRKNNAGSRAESSERTSTNKPKIALSDKEFGKY